jgi:hypothetical protein
VADDFTCVITNHGYSDPDLEAHRFAHLEPRRYMGDVEAVRLFTESAGLRTGAAFYGS